MHTNTCRMMVLSVIAAMAAGASARTTPAAGVSVMDATSLWRCRFVKGTDIVRRKSGELEHTTAAPAWKYVNVKIDGKRVRRRKLAKAPRMRRRPSPPAADWITPQFDDGSWGLYSGPFKGSGVGGHRSTGICTKTRLIYLRGKFQVTNPAKVGDMTLSLSFEGGVVVYLNGKEIARSHMPQGEINANIPAEDYPEEVYVDPKGVVISGYNAPKKHPEKFKKRIRTAGGIKVQKRGRDSRDDRCNALAGAVALRLREVDEGWFYAGELRL